MITETLDFGSEAPDFELIGTDEKYYSLYSFNDKTALVIIFSCNHCPYVKAYEDRIIRLQKEFGEEVQFIAINSNDELNYPEDSFDNMKIRAEEKQFNFPYLRDKNQSVARLYGATHTPEIFLFNKDRKLVFHGKIDDNWKEPEKVKSRYLKNALNDLLSNKAVAVPETFTIGCTIKWQTS